MRFSDLQVGQTARIVKLTAGKSLYRQRLMVMGLLPGTEFQVVRKAPLGDPVEIMVRGFALSLRQDEANMLQLEGV